MPRRFRHSRLRTLGAVAAAWLAFGATVMAQPESELAPLDAARAALGQIEESLKREELSIQALFELAQSALQVRDALVAEIGELERRAEEIEDGRKQLGAAPAPGEPPESETLAAERTRLNAESGAVDAPLKEARLLAARAEELAAQITERRRSLYAQQLFVQSPSVLSPFLWRDAAAAFAEEIGLFGEWLRSEASALAEPDRRFRLAMAALTLIALGIALAILWRWWQRRVIAAVDPFPTPGERPRRSFARAVASFGAFLRSAITGPLVTMAVVQILEAYQLLSERGYEIAIGIVTAVVAAALGRAVASGVLAPEAPGRRLIAVDDRAAQALAGHLVWGARAMAAMLLLLVIHKVLDAAPVLTVVTIMLFALAVSALLLHLLVRAAAAQPPAAAAGDTAAPAHWLRAVGWLVLAVMVVALVAGYAGFAAFVATRLLLTIAILGVLYLLVVLTDTALVDRIAADASRGRAIAANIGINPRRLGLIASLLSGIICMLLIVGAVALIVGPLEATSTSFPDTLRRMAEGFRVGELQVSFGVVFAAAAILFLALIITRGLQSWLQRRILPRTELEPSLQQSIATIFGYVGVITAIVLTLSQLGIDLQKVALIAGALSVGIGFGLQAIVSNFVSGLILLAERPIRVGDLVVVKGEEGYVRRIRVRATEIETFERASVIIPNADFITGAVKNWTHANTIGRIIVKVGVAYDSDPDQVREILLACAAEHPRILQTPAPGALLLAFGDNALEFELRGFVDDIEAALGTRSDLHLAILRRFRAAGIAIPSPQREVRLVPAAPPP